MSTIPHKSKMNPSRGRTASRSNMPLHCSICPKNPDFSDISHLLTHIGSKGHLANYFNVEVKAASDPHSKRVFDDYIDWYETWGIRDLMHDRLKQKERKQGSATSGARRGLTAAASTSSNAHFRTHSPVPADTGGRRRARTLQRSMLDPQLDRRVKVKHHSRSATPSFSLRRDAPMSIRNSALPSQTWSLTSFEGSSAPFEQTRSSCPTSPAWSDDSEPFETRREDRCGDSESTHSAIVEEASDDMTNDASKLKGVYWTGMGMFDSATIEMRRKRNQKKATSVVQLLKATSEVVEPTELVFDAEGILQIQREITGVPEDADGRLVGESTPEPDTPPKRARAGRKPRQALREKNPNNARVLRPRGASVAPKTSNPRKRTRVDYDGMDDDDDLTYQRPRQQRRHGISVHRDNNGSDISFGGPTIHQNRMSLDLLTSGFRQPFTTCSPLTSGHPNSRHGALMGHDAVHHRESSLGFNIPELYRPNSAASSTVGPGFGSFGNLNAHHSIFAPYSNPFASNSVEASHWSHSLGFSGLAPCYNNNTYPLQERAEEEATSATGHHAWDIFGVTNQDLSLPAPTDSGFQSLTDFGSSNPLFLGENNDGLHVTEDDEATISAPASPENAAAT